jgi:hypothetical protein
MRVRKLLVGLCVAAVAAVGVMPAAAGAVPKHECHNKKSHSKWCKKI